MKNKEDEYSWEIKRPDWCLIYFLTQVCWYVKKIILIILILIEIFKKYYFLPYLVILQIIFWREKIIPKKWKKKEIGPYFRKNLALKILHLFNLQANLLSQEVSKHNLRAKSKRQQKKKANPRDESLNGWKFVKKYLKFLHCQKRIRIKKSLKENPFWIWWKKKRKKAARREEK